MNEAEEVNKIRKAKELEGLKQQRLLAINLLSANGENYLEVYGPEKLEQEIENIRGGMKIWNDVTYGTMSLNLATINIMIFCLSTINLKDQAKQSDTKFQEMYMILCAIRNRMMKERDQAIAKISPDLSTPQK